MPLSRCDSLSREDQTKFGHAFPDFAIELRSQSNRLTGVQEEMTECMENEVRLGWLIDPQNKRGHVYRPDPARSVEIPEEPCAMSGEPVLPGFVLDLTVIWKALPRPGPR